MGRLVKFILINRFLPSMLVTGHVGLEDKPKKNRAPYRSKTLVHSTLINKQLQPKLIIKKIFN